MLRRAIENLHPVTTALPKPTQTEDEPHERHRVDRGNTGTRLCREHNTWPHTCANV
jgi:hypothetical protein